ncbi:MAG: hypothetical protein H6574_10905 [Lewinellaceae bacterium]|nr:hypothetical protein [Saprospiraceae bacterium]MCB9317546.1 hypothetical protein [Lewinellaceae bacterium]MCB9331584.1 hypothetical protein [Lewinellaceae bacterium]
MIPPNDILGRRNEIKDCIAADAVADAVRRLIDFMRDFQPFMEDEAVLISMDFTELEKETRQELVERQEAKRNKRQIAHRILTTLNTACSKLNRA